MMNPMQPSDWPKVTIHVDHLGRVVRTTIHNYQGGMDVEIPVTQFTVEGKVDDTGNHVMGRVTMLARIEIRDV